MMEDSYTGIMDATLDMNLQHDVAQLHIQRLHIINHVGNSLA